ncbi:hypothetical protein [Pseudomonas sp. 18173]
MNTMTLLGIDIGKHSLPRQGSGPHTGGFDPLALSGIFIRNERNDHLND